MITQRGLDADKHSCFREEKATELVTDEFVFTDLPGRSVRPPRPVTKRPPSIESDDFLKPVPKAPYLDRTPSFKDESSSTSGYKLNRSQSPPTIEEEVSWGASTMSSMRPIGAQKAQILLNDSMEDLLESNGIAKQYQGYKQPKVDFFEPDRRRAPYGYPNKPDVAPRKRPPYAYPKSSAALNQEELAMARVQQRRMRYSDSSDT